MKLSMFNSVKISLIAGSLLLGIQNSNNKVPDNHFEIPQNDSSYTTNSLIKPLDKDIVTLNVNPKGTQADSILKYAPSPEIYIQNIKKSAVIVVDLDKNILFKYNSEGKPEAAYLVASGRKQSPTKSGVRLVTHVETYPYKNAPAVTKRYKKPSDYGPKIICLEQLNPETGEKSPTGQFIHGNHNAASIGKYASLGCIRMDNEVIKKLASEVKRGDIVIMLRSNND